MSGIRLKFHKAFTLAELMIILAVMTVVMAAVAPVFTSQYNRLMSDDVWHEVPADDNLDIYADAPRHSMINEVMIGLSPLDVEDIRRNYAPFSKLIVRSSDRITNGLVNIPQKPLEFYHNGVQTGYLMAGHENLMLAGTYSSVNGQARGNTAYGHNALNHLTSGVGNTAVGTNALLNLESGSFNTAVGSNAGYSVTTESGNVIIGYNVSATGDNNTIISNDTVGTSNYTTAIGNNISYDGDYNVVIGEGANGNGNYNTAVGSYALSSHGNDGDYFNFNYSTAIGYKSCSGIPNGSEYITCIGQANGNINNNSVPTVAIGRNVESVYRRSDNSWINLGNNNTGGAVLVQGGDHPLVTVYGNLIVRGQTYMYGQSPFPIPANSAANYEFPKSDSLMGFVLFNEAPTTHKPYIGFDGSSATTQLLGENQYLRQLQNGKEHCICTYSGGMLGSDMGYSSPGIQSYDWSTDYNLENQFDNLLGGYSYNWSGSAGDKNVELSRARAIYEGSMTQGSCCPILTPSGTRRFMSSDIRLKNVKNKFEAGLDRLEKLKIYNFTFKADKNSVPQVGVMAQDLKTVFPNAVSKDEKGYYQIRWDEMFYAAINSIKELNNKIVSLISRVENDLKRIEQLKNENKELEEKLLKLADEVEKLEHNK